MKQIQSALSNMTSQERELCLITDKMVIKKQLKGSFGRLYSGLKTNLSADNEGELRDIVHALLHLGLRVDARITEIFRAADSIPKGSAENLIKSSRGIVTHSAKMVNPRVPSQNVVAYPQRTDRGITSADAEGTRNLYFSGSARQSIEKCFWVTSFEYENQQHCILDLMADRHLAVLDVLDQWPLHSNEKETLIQTAQSIASHSLPHQAFKKQILLPIYDQQLSTDYIAVSPIPSVRVTEAITQSFDRFRNRHRDQKTGKNPFFVRGNGAGKRLSIGGNKPVNINDFVSGMAGSIPVIEATIPRIRKSLGTVEKGLEGRSLIMIGKHNNEFASWIDRKIVHINQIPGYEKTSEAFVEASFAGVLEYSEYLQQWYDEHFREGKEEPWEAPIPQITKGLPGITRALLNNPRIKEEEIDGLTKAFLDAIQKWTFETNPMTNIAFEILSKTIEKSLRNWRNPMVKHHG